DCVGEARLRHAESSELNSLQPYGPGELVPVTTLDAEDAAGRWRHVDLLKLDAEGVEEKILAGARRFFERHAPLALFEVTSGQTPNAQVADAFRALGFALFRSLPDVALLVPCEQELDGYELNLFAVPGHRVGELAKAGFLISEYPAWRASPDDI